MTLSLPSSAAAEFQANGVWQAATPGHPDFVGLSEWFIKASKKRVSVLQLPDFRRYMTVYALDGAVLLQGMHQAVRGQSMTDSLRAVLAGGTPKPITPEYDDPYDHFDADANPLPSTTAAHKRAVARVCGKSASELFGQEKTDGAPKSHRLH